MAAKPEKLSWQPGSYSMEYIVKNFRHYLPQVIQCDHTACGQGDGSNDVGCGPPLLLHSLSNLPRAVGVRLVEGNGRDKALKETKDRFVIPFDYKGWFILSGRKPNHDDVNVYNNISAVVEAGCEYFIIGGEKRLDILRKTASAHTNEYATALANPGDKMKVMGLVKHEKMYLQCMDETNQVILVDKESKGVFYIISTKHENKKVLVLQMKDIISSHLNKVPCVVKLLLGNGPLEDRYFTGWLKLGSLEKTPTVLVSTVTLGENGLLELPQNSQLKYRIATLNTGWKEYAGYKDALRLSRRFADEYIRSIKLATAKITPACVLRGAFQSGSQGLLDRSISKGFAPALAKTRHFNPRAAKTIFESESGEGKSAGIESVDETQGDYEMQYTGNNNDRDYENCNYTEQSGHVAYVNLVQISNPATDTNTYLTPISDSSISRDKKGTTSDGDFERKRGISSQTSRLLKDGTSSSHISGKARITLTKDDTTDLSSSLVRQDYPEEKIYANEDAINEMKQDKNSHEGEHRQMGVAELVKVFDPVFTETQIDSHDDFEVDDIVLDKDATAKSIQDKSSTFDYVNVQYTGMRNVSGRQVCKSSTLDSGVGSSG